MFGVLLRILHIIFHVIDVLCDAISSFERKYNFFKYTYILDKTYIYKEISQLQKLEKLPVHLTVLLGTEEPSLKDLANLIVWSLTTRISFISFYDSKGDFEYLQETLHSLYNF